MPRHKIRSDSSTPIRAQMSEILIEKLRTGYFLPGSRIPSERELAETYGISRASVREAITELINSGFLFRTVGKGTFVSLERPAQPQSAALQSRSIGFVISEDIFQFVQTGYNKTLQGVEEVCRREGYQLMFNSLGNDARNFPLKGKENGQALVEGCIVVGGVRHHILDRLKELRVPTVLVDLLLSDDFPNVAAVNIDYAEGTRMAIRHLRELGHREIGYIGFSNSQKYDAYWKSLEEFGLRYEPRYVEFLQLLDLEPGILAGFHSMQRILARAKLPTAILVTNDFVALGAMEALGVNGVRVPEQMSVVGFDDLGQASQPPLTTVRVDLNEVGGLAARSLFREMRGETVQPDRIVVPVELVVRSSTAPALEVEEQVRAQA